MQRLVRGVHKFQQEVVGKQAEFYAELAKGQRPHTLFITCSDSRISPNLLTQTAPGEIFILRNAGNIIPPHSAVIGGEAATIEYAVGLLGVTDIVVCGHSHCGAMTGLLAPGSVADLPAMRTWLGHAEATRRIVKENYANLSGEALVNVAIQENVLVQLENLRTIPVVAARLASGRLHLHGWVYKIETGEVFAYDPAEAQFQALARYQPKPAQPRSFTGLPTI
jgi:carbonic anhydrase